MTSESPQPDDRDGETAAPPLDRRLSDMPKDVLAHLAEDLGLDPTRYDTARDLAEAVQQRRQLIAAMDRAALLEVIRWGRRPVAFDATNEQIAQEIARIQSMRFSGLSQRGLVALARLRGLEVADDVPTPRLRHLLKKQEGFFSRLNRRRRALLGSIVANIVGDGQLSNEYEFLPPEPGGPAAPDSPPADSLKADIEESGLFGGITSRIKRTADQYLNQKLDEIEARIDRKLDEIDRRLAEWRDKEIANRIRILKITLWASVIVAVVSLIYSYVTAYLWPH
ncbi:MAG: hypothetical protein ABR964_13180 [Tepidisphaeraceae bacterium]|jgi:hypothetical protein